MKPNSKTETTAITKRNSTSNNSSQLISSHCSNKSGMMMKDHYLTNNQSDPSSDVSFDDGLDIDLKGIPSFILNLQQTQPTLNIMTCGDVSHGKSTLLAALSGEKTGKHAKEKANNMTIRLGYTSCKIWKCLLCPHPECYFTKHSDLSLKKVNCPNCGTKPTKSHNKYQAGNSKVILIRHLSFVDVPGHAQLMQTMVSATSVADGAILVIDASKPVPGKQTAQHLDAMNLLGLMKENKMIIAQNKIDLINPSKACRSFEEIRSYLETFGNDTFAFSTPIIPISAQSKLNIDALCNSIINHLPKYSPKLVPNNNDNDEYKMNAHSAKNEDLFMNIIRSFDVNKAIKASPLSTMDDIDRISGGVIGGAVINGHIEIGQKIEIRPGYLISKKVKKYKNVIDDKLQQQWTAQPIQTVVKSLKYGRKQATDGYSGGNVGVQTNIDPSLTKSDGMCGHIVIDANHPNPPPIFNKFIMSYSFLADFKQKKFKQLEVIRVNIGSFKMKAEVIKYVKEYDRGVLLVLEAPICARVGDKVGICRQNKQQEWAFVAGGIIRKTKNIKIKSDQEKLNRKNGLKEENNQSQRARPSKVAKPDKIQNGDGHQIKTVAVSTTSLQQIVDTNKETVHLNYQQRNGRKGITTIVGLPIKVNFKKLMKKMKKKFSTGATLIDDQEKGQIIQVQGDLKKEIADFIVKLGIVEMPQVIVHGY